MNSLSLSFSNIQKYSDSLTTREMQIKNNTEIPFLTYQTGKTLKVRLHI